MPHWPSYAAPTGLSARTGILLVRYTEGEERA